MGWEGRCVFLAAHHWQDAGLRKPPLLEADPALLRLFVSEEAGDGTGDGRAAARAYVSLITECPALLCVASFVVGVRLVAPEPQGCKDERRWLAGPGLQKGRLLCQPPPRGPLVSPCA